MFQTAPAWPATQGAIAASLLGIPALQGTTSSVSKYCDGNERMRLGRTMPRRTTPLHVPRAAAYRQDGAGGDVGTAGEFLLEVLPVALRAHGEGGWSLHRYWHTQVVQQASGQMLNSLGQLRSLILLFGIPLQSLTLHGLPSAGTRPAHRTRTATRRRGALCGTAVFRRIIQRPSVLGCRAAHVAQRVELQGHGVWQPGRAPLATNRHCGAQGWDLVLDALLSPQWR